MGVGLVWTSSLFRTITHIKSRPAYLFPFNLTLPKIFISFLHISLHTFIHSHELTTSDWRAPIRVSLIVYDSVCSHLYLPPAFSQDSLFPTRRTTAALTIFNIRKLNRFITTSTPITHTLLNIHTYRTLLCRNTINEYCRNNITETWHLVSISPTTRLSATPRGLRMGDDVQRRIQLNTNSKPENPFEYALSSNAAWAGYKNHQNPKFFPTLAQGQSPSIREYSSFSP
jgi:hypothetical protein